MKKTILILAISIVIGCGGTKHFLKGSYQSGPYQIETTKSFEEVWSNIIDLFATRGFSIKIIDKSSGLITSEEVSLISSYSYEDKEGRLINPEAFLVVNKITNGYGSPLNPQNVSGEWNVRIKTIADKTMINVNLVNVKAQYTSPPTQYSASKTYSLEAKSTGKFEQLISGIIK